jgi:hypothetical protein
VLWQVACLCDDGELTLLRLERAETGTRR